MSKIFNFRLNILSGLWVIYLINFCASPVIGSNEPLPYRVTYKATIIRLVESVQEQYRATPRLMQRYIPDFVHTINSISSSKSDSVKFELALHFIGIRSTPMPLNLQLIEVSILERSVLVMIGFLRTPEGQRFIDALSIQAFHEFLKSLLYLIEQQQNYESNVPSFVNLEPIDKRELRELLKESILQYWTTFRTPNRVAQFRKLAPVFSLIVGENLRLLQREMTRYFNWKMQSENFALTHVTPRGYVGDMLNEITSSTRQLLAIDRTEYEHILQVARYYAVGTSSFEDKWNRAHLEDLKACVDLFFSDSLLSDSH